MKKAVGYIRVSTRKQQDAGNGLDAQRAAVEAWCKANGAELVDVVVEQASGGAELAKRPGLLHALAMLKAAGAEVLVVAKRCRLARDVVVAATAERMASKAGAKIASADGAGIGDGPEAALMRAILDSFGAYERAVIAARTAAALQAKKAKGERVGAVPRGWQAAGKVLVKHQAEQDVLDVMRTLRAQGWTLRAIAGELKARGVLTRGGRPYCHSQVAKALKAAA